MKDLGGYPDVHMPKDVLFQFTFLALPGGRAGNVMWQGFVFPDAQDKGSATFIGQRGYIS
jgi:hypothetical protein